MVNEPLQTALSQLQAPGGESTVGSLRQAPHKTDANPETVCQTKYPQHQKAWIDNYEEEKNNYADNTIKAY